MIALEKHQEYRFELDENQAISIKLVSGTAECFGLELALDVVYPFGNEVKAAIFTWTGCELEMSSRRSLHVQANDSESTSLAKLRQTTSLKKLQCHVI